MVHPNIAVKMTISVVGDSGKSLVFKLQQCTVRTLGGARGIPLASASLHTAHFAATQQTHHIDLMGGLAVDHAATQCGVQFFRASGTVQKVGVVEGRDHANLPQLT